jgi:hypothetical protein
MFSTTRELEYSDAVSSLPKVVGAAAVGLAVAEAATEVVAAVRPAPIL